MLTLFQYVDVCYTVAYEKLSLHLAFNLKWLLNMVMVVTVANRLQN